ncbi:DUF1698 domain-containing protein [Acidithiobacillus thiooxidans]|uniref:DUF1698 domain-containing protein n=1 Tax=Acidithiobacillus thiooxidans TaxID=930 RepID=UPI001C06CE8A|nr:DUF1698 domain-containing protein [Acidithiobacillus thiooxidans]MBU2810437.1 DUF1698 domain-containing protein [Acidithiobacillus thiooxidans]
MVSTTKTANQHLVERIQNLKPWHYAFSFHDGITTPVRDPDWINRHLQRAAYFFDPLVAQHAELFAGARVLDLGCNAGFWTLRALAAGAREVVAVDARPHHLEQLKLVLDENGIAPERYLAVEGNIFDLDYSALGEFDVVLCLGLLYHVAKPFELLEKIATLQPRCLLIDTKISRSREAILEVLPEPLDDPRMAADWGVVMVPSATALSQMLQVLGFRVESKTPEFSDWTGAGDYRDGDRQAFWCWRDQDVSGLPDQEIQTRAASLTEPPKPLHSMVYFTICAGNYLAQTFAFAESLRAFYPEAELQVFLLDDPEDLPVFPGVRWRRAEDVLSAALWVELSVRYSILELATALKPYCFQKLFAEDWQQVIYCDPDLIFYARPYEMESLLNDGASGVILPHILTPLPRDSEQADDLAILKSGVFNLGFLALSACAETEKLLSWWAGWLRTECWADPRTGVFTDQRWMDFVPCLWSGVKILYHPGYDVAYWNLHERRLDRVSGQWRVNDVPLVFFHFSGFNPKNLKRLSKHETRFSRLDGTGPLSAIMEDYRDRLIRHDFSRYSRLPLPSLRFEGGITFDLVARRAFQMTKERNLEFPDPLSTGPGSFFEWLLRPELGSAHSRYVHALLALREGVQAAYPDYEGEHIYALRRWIVESGAREIPIEKDMLTALGLSSSQDIFKEHNPLQVNYVGYLRAEMGVGEAARGYVKALRQQAVNVALMDISQLSEHRCEDRSLATQPPESMPAAPGNLNIVHVNADMLPSVLAYLGSNFTEGRYTIGLWAWESAFFPEQWRDRSAYLDEIWVGSQFMASAIAPWADCPVIVMPHVVDMPLLPASRTRWQIPEQAFVFLFLFDFHSVVERKNPYAVIEAFRQAFTADEEVLLVIKTMAADRYPEQYAHLQACVRDVHVQFINETLDRDDLLGLIASCDVFVSLHRLEGFGLGMAEAMAQGKAVIGTAYGGNVDFMRPGNSILVPYTLKKLDKDYGPYVKESFWAEPDLAYAAREMQHLFADRAFTRHIGEQARHTIQEEFSLESVGLRMLQRLELLDKQGVLETSAQSEIDASPVTTSPSITGRRLRTFHVLLGDLLRSPKHYWRRAPNAWIYWRQKGTGALRRRVVEELRRRGRG